MVDVSWEGSSIIGSVAIGLVYALLASLVGMFVAAFLLLIGLDWALYLHYIGLTLAFASIILGAAVAGSRAGAHGWAVGLITAGGFILICLCLSLLAGIQGLVFSQGAAKVIAACLTGAVGGALGVNLGVR